MAAIPKNACLFYVYGDKGDGLTAKIGKTRNSGELRMRQHERRGDQIVEMRPLAILWAHDADETAAKRYWKKKEAIKPNTDEWVKAGNPEFREWVRFLRAQAYVARSFEELDAGIPYVDGRHWLPNQRNGMQAAQGKLSFNNDPWADLDLDDIGDGDFYTNRILVEAARATMGGIDLDPASCRLANSVVRADRYYSALQDGLTMKWDGRIWLNPPFNQWGFWSEKLITELNSGRITQACVLCPTRASTAKNFHVIPAKCDAMFLPEGRIKFWGPKAGSPDEGHLIFYFGEHIDHFDNAFSPYGTVFLSAQSRLRQAA